MRRDLPFRWRAGFDHVHGEMVHLAVVGKQQEPGGDVGWIDDGYPHCVFGQPDVRRARVDELDSAARKPGAAVQLQGRRRKLPDPPSVRAVSVSLVFGANAGVWVEMVVLSVASVYDDESVSSVSVPIEGCGRSSIEFLRRSDAAAHMEDGYGLPTLSAGWRAFRKGERDDWLAGVVARAQDGFDAAVAEEISGGEHEPGQAFVVLVPLGGAGHGSPTQPSIHDRRPVRERVNELVAEYLVAGTDQLRLPVSVPVQHMYCGRRVAWRVHVSDLPVVAQYQGRTVSGVAALDRPGVFSHVFPPCPMSQVGLWQPQDRLFSWFVQTSREMLTGVERRYGALRFPKRNHRNARARTSFRSVLSHSVAFCRILPTASWGIADWGLQDVSLGGFVCFIGTTTEMW